MVLSEQALKKIDRELAKFPADQRQSAVMAALAIAQDETNWLSPEVMQIRCRLYWYACSCSARGSDLLQYVQHKTSRQTQNYGLHQFALRFVWW